LTVIPYVFGEKSQMNFDPLILEI